MFLALIFAVFLGTTMSVQASNLFEVKNVSVDAEASSALEARGIALKNGQTRAFQVLLKRLTRVEDWPVLPIVNEQEIETFVRRFRLQDEKTSTRRYLASMSVVFEPETVLDLLRNLNIPFSETQARPMLLLPVLEDVDGYRLWDNHWWAESWAQMDLSNIPAPMVLPLGDPEDRAMLDVEDVLLSDTQSMAALAKRYNVDTSGKHTVVIGRSDIVGRPISILMSQKSNPGNSTVTLAHSRTKNIEELTRQADIVISALGVPNFVNADMVKEGAVIVDVGITRVADNSTKGYKIIGDVDYVNVSKKSSYITPVPGGVGPMTIAMLLKNTLLAYKG